MSRDAASRQRRAGGLPGERPAFRSVPGRDTRDGRLGWPGEVLWWVVVGSSAFLTAREFLPVPGEIGATFGTGPIRRRSEALAYPVVLFLAVYLVVYRIGFSIF